MIPAATSRRTTALLAPLVLAVGVCWGQPNAPAPVKPLKTLSAVALSGQPLAIAAQKGWKVVYFWSGSCPCVRDCEQLSLIPLARKYAGQVTFYAVAANRPDLDQARTDRASFTSNVGTHGLSYTVVLDPKHAVTDALGAVVTPQAFLIDPQGHVLFNGPPDDSWTVKAQTGRPGVTQPYLADALTEALAGKPVSRPHVKSLGCGIVR